MTVLTKIANEKEKKPSQDMQEPLMTNDVNGKSVDVESGVPKQYVVLHTRAQAARAQRISASTMVCVFLTALLLLGMAVVGSIYLYQQMYHAKFHNLKGWCLVPYPPGMLEDTPILHATFKPRRFFYEDLEFNPDVESEELIDVPHSLGGRAAAFIHDFGRNLTTIVDKHGGRCYVMPLDRRYVLPPHSLMDVFRMMGNADYRVDNEMISETAHIIQPPLASLDGLGIEVMNRCFGLPTYRLQKDTHPMSRRSADHGNRVQFMEFAGHKVIQLSVLDS